MFKQISTPEKGHEKIQISKFTCYHEISYTTEKNSTTFDYTQKGGTYKQIETALKFQQAL
jgi:hypothetical protein